MDAVRGPPSIEYRAVCVLTGLACTTHPAVREVLARMKDLQLAGPAERTPSTTMNGLHTMPVRFTPAAAG
jgi:hypothetical protein